jgi:hypothetical protein
MQYSFVENTRQASLNYIYVIPENIKENEINIEFELDCAQEKVRLNDVIFVD